VLLVAKNPRVSLALGKRGLLVEALEIWDCKWPEMLMERVTFGNVRGMALRGSLAGD